MSNLLELHEFFVSEDHKASSHVLLHITEPQTTDQWEKGYFFALVEIVNGSRKQIEELQTLLTTIESTYYEIKTTQENHAFETTLELANSRSHHILKYTHSTLHCFVGVARGHDLVFATYGKPLVTIFYTKQQQLLGMEITNTDEQEPEDKNELFSSITEGTLNTNDSFFVATPNILKHISRDRLQKIIESRTTEETVEHIGKILQQTRDGNSYGGFLLHRTSQADPTTIEKQPKPIHSGSAASLDNLLNQEKKTTETLFPSLINDTKKKLKITLEKRRQTHEKNSYDTDKTNNHSQRLSQRVETNYRPTPKHEPKQSLLTIFLVGLGKAIVVALLGIGQILKAIAMALVRFCIGILILVANTHGGRRLLFERIHERKKTMQRYIRQLPLVSRILFGLTLIFALVFIGSIVYIRFREAREQTLATLSQELEAIEDKQQAAQASLLYGDNSKAFRLLQEAKQATQHLANEEQIDEEKKEEILSGIEKTLMGLRKVTVVTPTVLAEFPSGENPSLSFSKLASLDNRLIVYTTQADTLYELNKETKVISQKSHESIPVFLSASTPKEEDKIVFRTGKNTIAEYNKETSGISQKDISFPNTDVDIAALFVYNRRLYTLDVAHNQLYKHNQTQTGYDKGTAWIQQTQADLENSVSFAIDGDIFVLKNNGNVLKFSQGIQQPFEITQLDPALDAPVSLWTYNDTQYLYILEPTNKRVVVLNKDGSLKKQYTAENWKAPTDMLVDEAKEIIYILDDNKLFSFTTE